MTKSLKRQVYEKQFWASHTRVTVTLPNAEIAPLAKRAKSGGRTLGQQMKAESDAYIAALYVPSTIIEERLQEISLLIRNEANNLNQLTRYSHTLKRLICDERSLLLGLQNQEKAIEQMIQRPWQVPRSPKV